MKINYHNKRFRVLRNEHGDVPAGLVFTYQQIGQILICNYSGGDIERGHILGTVDPDTGVINFVYQQLDKSGELFSGLCTSTPRLLPDGKLQLDEDWRWTYGKTGAGNSILIEVD